MGGLVTRSCLTFATPWTPVHGIFQARVLESVAIAFSKECTYSSFTIKSASKVNQIVDECFPL